MVSVIRRFLAFVAGCGLAASILAYLGSYKGKTFDGLGFWPFVLHLGVLAVSLSMLSVEYSAVQDRTFFWDEFARGMPKWVVPAIKILGLIFLFHFVLFLALSQFVSPQISGGQYIANNHGSIVKILSQSEYFRLKAAELRMFATGWAAFLLCANNVLVVP